MPHGTMAAEQTGAGMFAADLHALDVSAVDELTELADELHDGDALPFHVAAVEVEADDAFIAGLAHVVDVIGGRFDVPHGAFARVAFEIERDAIFLAGVPHGSEALYEQFEAHLPRVGDGEAADA